MRFKDFDTVRILSDCADNVKAGEIGAVIMSFETPQEAYEVEVLDEDGNTKAICTLLPDDIELI